MHKLQEFEETYDKRLQDGQITKTSKAIGFVLDARAQEIDRHMAAKQAIRQQFLEKGIDPIAIMPAHLWENICKESRLYRFEHLKGDMATTWLKQTNAFGTIIAIMTYVLPILMTAALFIIRADSRVEKMAKSGAAIEPLFVIAFVAIMTPFIIYIAESIVQGNIRTIIASKSSRLWLRLLPRKVLFRQAFRGHSDCPEQNRLTCRISFPTPQTDHFLSVLEKSHHMQQTGEPKGFRCCVAIEPSEIAWDPATIIDFHKQQEVEMLRRLKADPILYCYAKDKGDPNEYAIILAHEGEFPNERKAMDMVYRTTG